MIQEENSIKATVIDTSTEQTIEGVLARIDVSTDASGNVVVGGAVRDQPPEVVSNLVRLAQARALREVAADEVTGEPAFEPGSIEAFADEDGRTMVVRVSFGELVKTVKAEVEV